MMTSPFGDHCGKLYQCASSVSGVTLLSARDWMTSWRPRLYTIRLPSGDQLGKPLLTPPSAITRNAEPSGWMSATCEAGSPGARKYLPTENAMVLPSGDQTASNALYPSR